MFGHDQEIRLFLNDQSAESLLRNPETESRLNLNLRLSCNGSKPYFRTPLR